MSDDPPRRDEPSEADMARALARGLTAGLPPAQRKACLLRLRERGVLTDEAIEFLIRQLDLGEA